MTTPRLQDRALFAACVALGCNVDVVVGGGGLGGTETALATTTQGSSETTVPAESDAGDGTSNPVDPDSTGGGELPIYDVGTPDLGVDPGQVCTLGDDISGIGPCDSGPLAESFVADVQWAWGEGEWASLTTPLVANLTDDNDDGNIDLCDTPDVVVLVSSTAGQMGKSDEYPAPRIFALDGDSGPTGDVHWSYEPSAEQPFDAWYGPALGDIDGDGLVEIVAVTREGGGANSMFRLTAISNDGEEEWTSAVHPYLFPSSFSNLALADLDADGDVEIMAGGLITDHVGNEVALISGASHGGFGADLDGDGDLEYVHSGGAHHHDGTLYFQRTEFWSNVFPHVADIDDDGLPEVIYSQHLGPGMSIYNHDGTLVTSEAVSGATGLPGAVHDMDGDGAVDFAVGFGGSKEATFSVVNFLGGDPAAAWTVDTVGGCCAGGTAFDFLGDGTAEAIFADDYTLMVFDEIGTLLTSSPRRSGTITDYPVVADVDNDGAAEIAVVASSPTAPAVTVLRDMSEGWVPARRIWNQFAYHVTNVREDGTIPAEQPKNWETLNTFRTQAQIAAGGVCFPAG